MGPAAGAAVLASLLGLTSSSFAVASGRPPRAETNREVAAPLARRLLAAAIMPLSEGSSGLTLQAQAPTPELDQPMDLIGSDDLIDIHRFLASSLSAADFVAFALAHPPSGTKLTEGQYGSTLGSQEQNLMWIDLRPPRGVETAVLEYSLYQLGAHRTGLRLDSQVIWLPPRTSDTLVPSSDRRATIPLNSFATAVGTRSLRLGPGTRLRRLIDLLNRLATVPPDSYALGCDDVTSSYAISFHADTSSPANAEISGQIGCPQLNLRVRGHRIQLMQAALVRDILALRHLTSAELYSPGG